MWVKICGITEADQAVAIAQLGATALGFICVEQSPRFLPPVAIAAIVSALQTQGSPTVETVGVFANPDLDTLRTAVAQARIQTVQLHGDESPDFCQQVRLALPGIRLIKAFRIRAAADLLATPRYEPMVDALLLDAYHPQMLGGTGTPLDWSTLLAFRPRRPWILAGGLTPENIASALSQIAPDGIDVSSGVEISPGHKDLTKVKALFTALGARS